MRLRAIIESEGRVNAAVFKLLSVAQEQATIEAAAKILRGGLNAASWAVFEGGHHIALHRRDEITVRVAIVREIEESK